MTMSSNELERLADEGLADARLMHSVYCGTCGYNLKTLPYLGVCPECGGHYNARPLKMEGIYQPQSREMPVTDFVLVLICAAFTYLVLRNAWNPFCPGCVFVAVVVIAAGLVCVLRCYDKLSRFVKFRQLEKRIMSGEDD